MKTEQQAGKSMKQKGRFFWKMYTISKLLRQTERCTSHTCARSSWEERRKEGERTPVKKPSEVSEERRSQKITRPQHGNKEYWEQLSFQHI